MTDEDLTSLTIEELNQREEAAIAKIDEEQAKYPTDNISNSPDNRTPSTPMTTLQQHDDALQSAQMYLNAVRAEIEMRKAQ
jgi:hypothetical protein